MIIHDNILKRVFDNDVLNFVLNIPDGVTEIDSNAFDSLSFNVKELNIPDSILYFNPNSLNNKFRDLKRINVSKNISIHNFRDILKKINHCDIDKYFKYIYGVTNNLEYIIKYIKLCKDIYSFCEDNNIEIPKKIQNVPSNLMNDVYSFDNTFLETEELDSSIYNQIIVKNDNEVELIFRVDDLNREIQINTSNGEIIKKLRISDKYTSIYEILNIDDTTYDKLKNKFDTIKYDFNNKDFIQVINNNLNKQHDRRFDYCYISNLYSKITEKLSFFDKLPCFKETDIQVLSNNDLDFILSGFRFETVKDGKKYNGVAKIRINYNIDFTNLENNSTVEIKTVNHSNCFFINEETLNRLENMLKLLEQKYNEYIINEYSFSKINMEDFGFSLGQFLGAMDFSLKDLKSYLEKKEILDKISNYYDIVNDETCFIGKIGNFDKNIKLINGGEIIRHFEYEYDGIDFYLIDLDDNNKKYKINEEDYFKHKPNFKYKINRLFKTNFDILEKWNIFINNPTIKLIHVFKSKGINPEMIDAYKPFVDENILFENMKYLQANDLLKYLDLSKIKFKNIENMNLSGTNAKVYINELENRSLRGTDLTNVQMFGQSLDGINIDGAVLIGTHVFVDLTKTITENAIFDETCIFWLGSREISAVEARMLGVNVIKRDTKKIHLKV